MSSIESTVQKAAVEPIIDLFTLDATRLGGGIFRWISGPLNGNVVSYQGLTYTPVPIEAEGFEWNGRGALPTPKIRVPNTAGLVGALLLSFGDVLGATVTRLRTFVKYLDGQPGADPQAHFIPETFRVERKGAEDNVFVEWELAASIDQEGKMLPGRQCIRDTCMWVYRRANLAGTDFDYTNVTCPYVGAAMFKSNGQPTMDIAEDQCGHRLSDCRLRFGSEPLPFGGFPGMLKGKV